MLDTTDEKEVFEDKEVADLAAKIEEGDQEKEVVIDEQKQPEPLTIEKLASSWGWNPNYDGPNKKSAEDYVKEERAFNNKLRRDMAQNTQRLENLGSWFKTQLEQVKADGNAEIQRLVEERKQAVSEGDVDRFEAIEQKIQAKSEAVRGAEQAYNATAPVAPQADAPAQYQDFLEKNPWYMKDERRTAFADRLWKNDVEIMSLQGKDIGAAYAAVEKAVKDFFGDAVAAKPNEPAAPAATVEGGGSRSGSSSGGATSIDAIYSQLPSDIRQICDDAVRYGGISRADYINSLRKQGVIR